MRLIDADELKKHKVYSEERHEYIVPVYNIDNAPTVELFCSYLSDGEVRQPCVEAPCEHERPQDEWIDYDNTFYKCPDCGYLLEKCCPQCQNKVILPSLSACDRYGNCEFFQQKEMPKGDLISREQVLKELMAHQYSQDFCKEHGIEYSINSGMVRIIVNRAPTVETPTIYEFKGCDNCELERPKGEWIPVSDRLPDDMQKVLIWFEYYRYGDFNCMYQTYGFGYVCDGKWSPFINGETGWQDYNIIAWQPLPEPYQKGGAEE